MSGRSVCPWLACRYGVRRSRGREDHATADGDTLSRNVVRQIRGQKLDDTSAVFRHADAAQRDIRGCLRLILRQMASELRVGARGEDQTGRNTVDMDAERTKFPRKKPRVLDNGRLRRAVGGHLAAGVAP